MKSNIEYKSQQITNKSNSNIISKINIQQQNIYANNFQQQPNFTINSAEDYDPLAVTFIEPKNQVSKIILPLTTNLEPKSLDFAPVNNTYELLDDEFSDFQCAQFTNTDSKNNHEFTDFQSAFDTLSLKECTKSVELLTSSTNPTSNSSESQQNLISYQDDIHDKYEVFRTLAAETNDIKNSAKENNHNDLLDVKSKDSIEGSAQNGDVYDDEFGDFLCVDEVSCQISNNKPEIEVDWKHVQVCIIYDKM